MKLLLLAQEYSDRLEVSLVQVALIARRNSCKKNDMADKVVHTCNLTMPLKKDLISRRPETSTLQMIKGPIHTNIQ